MSLPVAIYARVSTEEQSENFSIASQLDLLKNYCRSMQYKIYNEYVDPGYSGTTQDRPALKKLLEDASKGNFKMVIVYRIDRFFRSVKDLLFVVDHLDRLGVAFCSVTEPFDTSNPIGKFMLSLLGSIAQLERDTFIERSQLGKLRRAQEGYVVLSNPPLGYDYDRESGQLVINEQEAETVRLIFSEYIKPDASTLTVAKTLKALGRPTKKGGKWDGERVYSILVKSAYVGKWVYKSRKTSVKVFVPPIIDQATFNKAQELLKERRNMIHRANKRQYLLRSILKCKKCGWDMGGTTQYLYKRKNGKKIGKPRSEKHYYRCGKNITVIHYPERGLEKCSASWVKGAELENKVLEHLVDILSNPDRLQEAIGSQDNSLEHTKKELNEKLKEIDQAISRCNNEKERILKAYREELIELEDLGKEMDRIKERRQNLEQQAEELKLKISMEDNKVNGVKALMERYRGIDVHSILNAPFEEKREFLMKLVKVIWVDTREDGSIHLDIECIIPELNAPPPGGGGGNGTPDNNGANNRKNGGANSGICTIPPLASHVQLRFR